MFGGSVIQPSSPVAQLVPSAFQVIGYCISQVYLNKQPCLLTKHLRGILATKHKGTLTERGGQASL